MPSAPTRIAGRGTETRAVEPLLIAAAARLRAAGVDAAHLEAMLLLAHVLGATKADLLAHPERPVDPAAIRRFAVLIERRARREPYAYVVGLREFYGERLVVDARVLIPRPETETLVEQALSGIERLRARGCARPLVVDVGTGSGAIAFAIARRAPAARVLAADVSADALAVAAINRRRLGQHAGRELLTPATPDCHAGRSEASRADCHEMLRCAQHDSEMQTDEVCADATPDRKPSSARVSLIRGDLLDWLLSPADLVIANLPYLPSASLADLEPEVARFEPRQALDGGPDGTDLIRRLVGSAHHLVRRGGTILLELEPDQVEPIRSLATWGATSVIDDLAGQPRVLRIDVP